jgi:hypothetical protein
MIKNDVLAIPQERIALLVLPDNFFLSDKVDKGVSYSLTVGNNWLENIVVYKIPLLRKNQRE